MSPWSHGLFIWEYSGPIIPCVALLFRCGYVTGSYIAQCYMLQVDALAERLSKVRASVRKQHGCKHLGPLLDTQ